MTEAITGEPDARRDLRIGVAAAAGDPRARKTRKIGMPSVPKDLASALRWSAWIITQTARKNLSAQEAAAMTAALKEFRAILDARDADAKLAEAKKVLEEMKALRAKP